MLQHDVADQERLVEDMRQSYQQSKNNPSNRKFAICLTVSCIVSSLVFLSISALIISAKYHAHSSPCGETKCLIAIDLWLNIAAGVPLVQMFIFCFTHLSLTYTYYFAVTSILSVLFWCCWSILGFFMYVNQFNAKCRHTAIGGMVLTLSIVCLLKIVWRCMVACYSCKDDTQTEQKHLKIEKIYLGFSKQCYLCGKEILSWKFIWVIMHSLNCIVTLVIFVVHPPNPHRSWCVVHELNFLLLQIQPFILYLITCHILSKEFFDNYMKFVHYRKNIILNVAVSVFVYVVSITEFAEAMDPYGWKFGKYGVFLELALACFDLFKFIQTVVITCFIYAYLDMFPEKFNAFTNGGNLHIKKQVISRDAFGLDIFNFKENYHEMIRPFKVFIHQWRWFFVSYGVMNGLSVTCMTIAIIKAFYKQGCNLPASYFIHSTLETSFQFVCGLLLIFKLNCNHHFIEHYCIRFKRWVSIKNDDCGKQRHIESFLENELVDSPFSIRFAGIAVSPSTKILVLFVFSCAVPVFGRVVQYIKDGE
eukprot:92431_1